MGGKRKTPAPRYAGPTYPIVVETFRQPCSYDIRDWDGPRFKEPYCFNGIVAVRRYRITVEQIEEPVEVLGARLQKLWDESDNHHDHDPLRTMAERIGYELKNYRGEKRRPKEAK